MATDLKFHHIIVLVALLVSLVGTLLVLEKMSESGTPITSATTVGGENLSELISLGEEVAVQVVDGNETGGTTE